jgi:hypothetical protein
MSKIKIVIRYLLGAVLLVFGLNGFFQFMPMPPLTPEAGDFMGALVNTGYMMPFISIVKIVCGILLLSNKYVSLGLVLVFPVLLNAFLFHLILDIGGIAGALFAMTMNIYLFFVNKENYSSLLKA